jgi:NDP-sugar pyrophosphorylase family protein
MRSVSDTPKVLLPLGDKPILVHQLEWLKRSGFSEVCLCLGYQSDVIQEALGESSPPGLKIHYQVEETPRGTAGAVRDIGRTTGDDLLVIYGDLFIDIDCRKLLEFHATHDGVATVVVRRTDHPEDSDLAVVNADGRIQAVGRMERDGITSDLGCAAIWVVRPELLKRVPEEGVSDFARDIFPAAAAAGDKLMAYETSERVLDVGTPGRYAAFNESMRNA